MFIILGGWGGGEVNVALLWSEFVGSSEETELFFPFHLLTTKKERTAITNQSSYETNTLEKRRPETLSYRKLGITLIITFLKAHVFVRSNSVTILFHLIYIWFLFIYSISCKVCKKTTKNVHPGAWRISVAADSRIDHPHKMSIKTHQFSGQDENSREKVELCRTTQQSDYW